MQSNQKSKDAHPLTVEITFNTTAVLQNIENRLELFITAFNKTLERNRKKTLNKNDEKIEQLLNQAMLSIQDPHIIAPTTNTALTQADLDAINFVPGALMVMITSELLTMLKQEKKLKRSIFEGMRRKSSSNIDINIEHTESTTIIDKQQVIERIQFLANNLKASALHIPAVFTENERVHLQIFFIARLKMASNPLEFNASVIPPVFTTAMRNAFEALILVINKLKKIAEPFVSELTIKNPSEEIIYRLASTITPALLDTGIIGEGLLNTTLKHDNLATLGSADSSTIIHALAALNTSIETKETDATAMPIKSDIPKRKETHQLLMQYLELSGILENERQNYPAEFQIHAQANQEIFQDIERLFKGYMIKLFVLIATIQSAQQIIVDNSKDLTLEEQTARQEILKSKHNAQEKLATAWGNFETTQRNFNKLVERAEIMMGISSLTTNQQAINIAPPPRAAHAGITGPASFVSTSGHKPDHRVSGTSTPSQNPLTQLQTSKLFLAKKMAHNQPDTETGVTRHETISEFSAISPSSSNSPSGGN